MTTYPKPSVSADRAIRRKARAALERLENAKVKTRSDGQCEVWVRKHGDILEMRCPHRATEIHHMLGGRCRGRVAESAMAMHKQHVCRDDHQSITGEVGGKRLIRVGGSVPCWSDPYRRVR